MPEVHGQTVRLRIGVGRSEYERWEVLARKVGLPVDAMIEAALSRSLAGYEQRLALLDDPQAGAASGSGTAIAVDSAGGAGVTLNEKPAGYSANLPRRGPGGGKPRHR